MDAPFDLTTGKLKNTFQLYAAREMAEPLYRAGIKAKAMKHAGGSHGYFYHITPAQARKLLTSFPGEVTYYGEPIE